MPAQYQHLRIRLRIEETRLLNWGDKVGLVEERLDEPTHTLRQNRNIIIDLLLEMQALFKSCVKIHDKYDHLVPIRSVDEAGGDVKIEEQFPSETTKKRNRFLEKTTQISRRLQWAAVKETAFSGLVEKLIGYNTLVEGLLDSAVLEQVQSMQAQTYMAILQLNSSVAELKEISKAMKVETQATVLDGPPMISSHGHGNNSQTGAGEAGFARLADFKAQQISLESEVPDLDPIQFEDITLQDFEDDEVRSEAKYQNKSVWIEWKQYDNQSKKVIQDRIKRLAILLESQNKSEQFGAPECVGYLDDQDQDRYGFVYLKPKDVSPNTPPTSLYDLIKGTMKPSLSKRITLAHAIARCLMYLHSVDWLHKGLRSNNVVIFFTLPGRSPSYNKTIIAGYEYARPDSPNELTDRLPEHPENDIYRHPALLTHPMPRSQKSHDIYSLGVVLVEIAYWQPIDQIMAIPSDQKTAKARVKQVGDQLLRGDYMRIIEGDVGEVYAAAVRRCLVGGKELGIGGHAKETDAQVGARIQEVFSKEVVSRLAGIKV